MDECPYCDAPEDGLETTHIDKCPAYEFDALWDRIFALEKIIERLTGLPMEIKG